MKTQGEILLEIKGMASGSLSPDDEYSLVGNAPVILDTNEEMEVALAVLRWVMDEKEAE